jgi:hypothetical protein
MSENYINHIALVLDASGSMNHIAREVIKVADAQIAYLARRSKELDQETRVSVYVFSSHVRCVIYDKDVLRLPSIASHYRVSGNTALIDATLKSQSDLALTPEIYGDHAFLTYVLTDGEENSSRSGPEDLLRYMITLPDHWTVAVLVPDQRGKFEAKKFGFPADNIAVWDSTTVNGVVEVGETIRRATDNYMIARASGVRGSRSLFSTSPDALNSKTVKAAKLKPIASNGYKMLSVDERAPIREWVQRQGIEFRLGIAFYQLTKTESIQAQKNIAILNRKTGKVYTGAQARDLLGLPQMEVRVKPDFNPDFDVFVQSTSVNRMLVPGTKLLVIN